MKLIIEIPDDVYEIYKEWHSNGVATAEQSLIATAAKPYEERPKGQWQGKEVTADYKVYGQCSVCLQRKRIDNFCPNCGADMRKETDDDK